MDTVLDRTFFYIGIACIGFGFACISSALWGNPASDCTASPTPLPSMLHTCHSADRYD
ncbi:MAG: hypothetical protein AAGE59_30405 [Cyanobacteria bacterium P01_F01_bin.86]